MMRLSELRAALVGRPSTGGDASLMAGKGTVACGPQRGRTGRDMEKETLA
jgi:hypothetical protein